jgi:hypothetical protein
MSTAAIALTWLLPILFGILRHNDVEVGKYDDIGTV